MCQQNVASGNKVLGNATKLPRILNKAMESSGEAQRTQKLTWRQKLYGNNKPKLTTCKYVENSANLFTCSTIFVMLFVFSPLEDGA